nr:MAG TPA: hypothetical protein [Caudoviricetes sp.]
MYHPARDYIIDNNALLERNYIGSRKICILR